MTRDQLLIWWNNTFPYDRIWRKKYNISFGSKEHREINQIDVYFDMIEDKLISDHIERKQEQDKVFDHYRKTGEFLIEQDVDEFKAMELFDAIKF